MITSDGIKRKLWAGATRLRGSMDASRYKDYMLGLMFYKFLSDKTLEEFRGLSGQTELTEAELMEQYKKERATHGEELDKMLQERLGYYVLPEYLYQTWLKDINAGEFEVDTVIKSLNNFERTIAVSSESDDFKGLFSSSTLDLTDTALGSSLNERSKNIIKLIQLFDDLNMISLQKSDILGDAYEYLIGQFAMESGKKAGEFYTPRQVSEVMAQIVAKTANIESIYDPTVGSGSLLLTVKKHLSQDAQDTLNYYGQEKNTATYNLTRMNLLLHGVRPEKMTIKNGNTLSQDWPEDPNRPNQGVQFDAVVMNPPYSVKNWNTDNLKISDPRFDIAGVLPPDSKGDFAFLMHGLFHLGQTGTMAIVLPHGVLFRGAAEGTIRTRLLEKNLIDTIIGLPSNLFTNTSIPVAIMILKKNRGIKDPVLIIDSSYNYVKEGKQNVLQEKDIAKIVDTYVSRRAEHGYSHLATRQEIIENEFNLNIPRYVESLDDEMPQDVDAHLLGGIPETNIRELNVLNAIVPDTLQQALTEIRPGYLQLTKPIGELTTEILGDKRIAEKKQEISLISQTYIDKYWNLLRQVNATTNVRETMEEMLSEIKTLLATQSNVDIYNGYQIIAEIWKNALTKDIEKIAASDFYTIGRTREPKMVTKKKKNEEIEEQDGFIGSIVSTELIAKHLFSNEVQKIETDKARVIEIESELAEQVENAKIDDSNEALILGGSLNDNSDAFDSKAIKAELKQTAKGTEAYNMLNSILRLFEEKTLTTKAMKKAEAELKDAVQERILTLTDPEIDKLMYEKWFGNTISLMTRLIEKPLEEELGILELLSNRYKDTVKGIDGELDELEALFASMISELVVG